MAQKTIAASELSDIKMTTGNERRIKKVIKDGVVKEWVGMGWVEHAAPTRHQRRHLHHVVEG